VAQRLGEEGSSAEVLPGQGELASVLESAYRLPNARSLQAWIGTDSWVRMDGRSPWLITPDAASRVEPRLEWAVRPDFAGMWQTLLNLFTFGHNVALGRLGRAAASPARKRWQRGVDIGITLVAGLPLLVVALVLEGVAAAFGRGGWLKRG
jgi:hypothetical protein